MNVSLIEFKPIMEEGFIWFAYFGNNPIGFLPAVPDVNTILKYTSGNLDLTGKLKSIYYKHNIGFSRIRVVVIGIVPEFRNRGLESGLIYHAFNEGIKRPNCTRVELSWVENFNDKMIAIHKAMGATEDKQHITYRKKL